MSLGPITFLSPWILLAGLALPIIWLILRVTPPRPKRATFPPLKILQSVTTDEETPDHAPIWLLLLRMLLLACVIVAMARPVLTKVEGASNRPLVLIVDTGWTAAANWSLIVREAETRVEEARRNNVEVALLTTTDEATSSAAFESAADVLRRLKEIRPNPWPADYANLGSKLQSLAPSDAEIYWLSSGVSVSDISRLRTSFQDLFDAAARATLLTPPEPTWPIVPGAITETGNGFETVWHRASSGGTRVETVQAMGRDGRVIGTADIEFNVGQTQARASFELPAELRARIATVRVESMPNAGSMKVLDDNWGRPVVGIITETGDSANPLLSEPFFAEQALQPLADVFSGREIEMLSLSPSILIMPDNVRSDSQDMIDFVENGGMLIRFAGPNLAERTDRLITVPLRRGGRALGGALTWESPQKLENFSDDSPFFGLSIPEDVTISRQVMAEAGAETDTRTWARLMDGSPIVTTRQMGAGRIVLFHVSANTEWSTLPVSGLFVSMFERLLPFARATKAPNLATDGDWAPDRILTAFGRFTAPSLDARPVADNAFTQTRVSRAHPPGIYVQGQRRQALNIFTDPNNFTDLPNLSGVTRMNYGQTQDISISGLLLSAAIALLCLDMIFAIWLSGRWRIMSAFKPKRTRTFSGLVLMTIILWPLSDVAAQDLESGQSGALGLYLAYVETGDVRIDQLSEAAMRGLAEELTMRTTIEPDGVRGVDLSLDVLEFYPFLYWPIRQDTPALSPEVTRKVNSFMANGGTLIFDTQDVGDRFSDAPHPGLARVSENLNMPALAEIPEDHVLTKSFYLLQVFPGRWANGPVWVDRDRFGAARDGVSSVIIGGQDWAAAWAVDDSGQPIVSLEQDINRQREMAIRFGVNLTMYALSGNYKADQVHSAALIERLGERGFGGPDFEPDDLLQRQDP